jgi:2-C-methyl-D-erythritol 2,4-cyclodiphosphate synthase
VRVGFGYDAHKLVTGNDLVLAGIAIPFDRGLEGYSDADVAAHAVIDALLGAAGLCDCGMYFPAGDPRFRRVKSTELLRQTSALLAEAGFSVGNVDCTIVAEQPALLAHIPAMRASLASVLDLDVERVSVKAKRTEGLGFVGAGNGMEAYAVALIEERK